MITGEFVDVDIKTYYVRQSAGGASSAAEKVLENLRKSLARSSSSACQDIRAQGKKTLASQADAKASAELDKLAKTINVPDTSQAHNEILVEASHVEFDIVRADIPVGKDPHPFRPEPDWY